MGSYRAPLRDMHFILRELAPLEELARIPGFEDAAELAQPILSEAQTFAARVLEPLNGSGDREGARWRDGAVSMPAGFKAAYEEFAKAGWIGLALDTEYGGQGLPQLLHAPVLEMWHAANPGFANGPLLNQAAIEALSLAGSDEQQRRYIPQLVSGEWMGTMCLTEPQAGSDLGAVRTRAIADGAHYRVSGEKIFITFGEHDLTANILHLVLARLPDAPPGSKGLSLFVVPKFIADENGALGERNDVQCTSIEHKLGLNANPTCTMTYGESGGAFAELLGEPNRGLEYMFRMMNAARFAVGVQGIGLADRAFQLAVEFAHERVQGRRAVPPSERPVPIVEHSDVRRMLMSMKARIEAMRALAYAIAGALDRAQRDPDESVRRESLQFAEVMTPVVKAWCTESAVELVSTALQVFGGMGYVEETGIAQLYRDVRVTTIYEGTTGIQALDLVGRKILRDRGAGAKAIIACMRAGAQSLETSGDAALLPIARRLHHGVRALERATDWLLERATPDWTLPCATPYLSLWGIVAGGWQSARAAAAAARCRASGEDSDGFYAAKVATATFYAHHVLVGADALATQITEGSDSVLALEPKEFDLERL